LKRKTKKKPATRRARNRKPAFLAAFAACANVSAAADACGIDRGAHYEWLANDKDGKYRAAFDAAMTRAAQALEDEAVQRARIGVYEPLVYQGNFSYEYEQYEVEPAKPAGDWKDLDTNGKPAAETPAVMGTRRVPGAPPLGVWKKSDGLLMFLLRGFKPEKYRVAALEVTGKDGGPIEIGIVERLNAARDRLAAMPKPPR
jgi:hypothetical protein